jgi:hypothetical protein
MGIVSCLFDRVSGLMERVVFRRKIFEKNITAGRKNPVYLLKREIRTP